MSAGKALTLVFAVLLLAPAVNAISSQDAKNQVLGKNHFLEGSEEAEISPEVLISMEGKKYWVLTITSGSDLVGFIAVNNANGEVSQSRKTNRELFKTMYILRQLYNYKEAIRRSGSAWFFTSSTANRFSKLAPKLADEKFQLETVGNELNDATASQLERELSLLLDDLSAKAFEVQESMDSAIQSEQGFFSAPDVNHTQRLKQRFLDSFSKVEEFDALTAEYNSKLTQLKQIVTTAPLDPTSKQSLFKLLEKPEEWADAAVVSSDSKNVKQGIEEIYLRALNSVDVWLDNFDSDREMNDAWFLLYGDNRAVSKASGGLYPSVSSAAGVILSEEYIYNWRESEKVLELKSDWQRAENDFKRKNFSVLPLQVKKLETEIKVIFEAGFKEPEERKLFELGLNVVIYLIILLIIIYAVKHRKKLFSREEGGGEVEFQPFKG